MKYHATAWMIISSCDSKCGSRPCSFPLATLIGASKIMDNPEFRSTPNGQVVRNPERSWMIIERSTKTELLGNHILIIIYFNLGIPPSQLKKTLRVYTVSSFLSRNYTISIVSSGLPDLFYPRFSASKAFPLKSIRPILELSVKWCNASSSQVST